MKNIAYARINFWLNELKYPSRFFQGIGLKIAYFLGLKKNPFLPVKITIEPNNTCNFRCAHCHASYWNKKRVHLDIDSYKKIIRQFPRLVSIQLQGMGEPLLNKHFIDMLKIGEECDIIMSFISNGSICNPEITKELLQLNKAKIAFSLDGATAETYEKSKLGGNFEQVKKNIRFLTQVRENKKKPSISAWTLLSRHNIHELSQLIELSRDLGFDEITLQPFVSDWGKQEMKAHADQIRVDLDSDDLSLNLQKARELAKEKRVNLNVYMGNFFSQHKKCPWAWQSTYIAANGDVIPCSILSDSDTVKMGNVFETEFSEIWNSKAYQDFREKIRTHNLSEYCRNCYVDA